MLSMCTLFLVFREQCCIYSITFSSHAHYGRDKVIKILPLRRRETTSQRSACDLSGWPPQGTYTPQCHRTSTLFCHDLPILYWAQSLEKAQQHMCHITKLNQGLQSLLLESLSCRVYQGLHENYRQEPTALQQQSLTNNPIMTQTHFVHILALTNITELPDIDMHKFNRQGSDV